MRQFLREVFALKPVVALLLMGAFLLFLTVQLAVPAGTLSTAVSTVALAFCAITALARANDLDDWTAIALLRRIGMVAIVGGSVALAWEDLSGGPAPTWNAVLLRTGFALAMLSTPSQKPWWRMIAGVSDEHR